MSKKAISAGTDAGGKWHVFAGPSVPYQVQKNDLKALVGKDGKVSVDGKKGKVQLERWGMFVQTTKRYRRPRIVADPQLGSDVQA